MKPNEREKQAEKFSGLDKILYDRLVDKVGTSQPNTAANVAGGCYFGVLGLIPGVSTVFSTPLLMGLVNEARQITERSFSVDEVKEIINELGITSKNNDAATLKKIKRMITDREQGFLDQITDLQQKLNDYEAAKKEAQRRAVEKVKKGRTVDSKAITELRQAQTRIDELENEILELEQNRDDFSDLLKAEGIEHASTKRKLQNAINAAETLDTRLETAETEANNHKTRADIAEGVIKLRDQRIRTLEAEKKAAAPSFLKRNWNYFKTETTFGK